MPIVNRVLFKVLMVVLSTLDRVCLESYSKRAHLHLLLRKMNLKKKSKQTNKLWKKMVNFLLILLQQVKKQQLKLRLSQLKLLLLPRLLQLVLPLLPLLPQVLQLILRQMVKQSLLILLLLLHLSKVSNQKLNRPMLQFKKSMLILDVRKQIIISQNSSIVPLI